MDWLKLFSPIFVIANCIADLFRGDIVRPETTVNEWQLCKYDGDAPQSGEDKEPVEKIIGGDGKQTRRFVRGAKDGFVNWTEVPLENG